MNIIPTAYADFNLGDQYGFGKVQSVSGVIGTLLPAIFSVAGLLITFYFLFGAFKLLSSGGEKTALAEARQMITHAIVGFVMLILLFAIMKYIPEALHININIIK